MTTPPDPLPRLGAATLGEPPAGVQVPSYDRDGLRAGFVHLGLGHFYRAHQAVYLDDLLARGHRGWAAWGIGVRPSSSRTQQLLSAQDHLWTVTEKPSGASWTPRVVGSLVGTTTGTQGGAAVVERIAHPDTQVVSLTITEGGYAVDPTTREFTPDDAAVAADLRAERPDGTPFGLVLQAMALRRERGLAGVTVMSCDNVQDNGTVARTAFLGFARLSDPATADWMQDHVTFPGTMVDRVTPGTVDADRAWVATTLGYVDELPVTCEPFRQWVVQDRFAAGRPPLEEAGVDVVDDVEPYELMKLRLANGTHQALCFAGSLIGLTYVHEAITHPDIRPLLERYQRDEAVPTLAPVPGLDVAAFGRSVLERFGNPNTQDPLSRICAETSDRVPTFLLPVAHDLRAAGEDPVVVATVVALWARYAEGVDEQGRPIEVVDPRRDQVVAAARASHADPRAFLADRSLFGDLGSDPVFVRSFSAALATIRTAGVLAALGALVPG